MEKAQSEDKTLKLFPGGYHELIHDLEAEEMIQTVVEWIGERV
jgi:alpha-beta hydrolase superfamily lysophospholipase